MSIEHSSESSLEDVTVNVVAFSDSDGTEPDAGFLRFGPVDKENEVILAPLGTLGRFLSADSVELIRELAQMDRFGDGTEIRNRIEQLLAECFSEGRRYEHNLLASSVRDRIEAILSESFMPPAEVESPAPMIEA